VITFGELSLSPIGFVYYDEVIANIWDDDGMVLASAYGRAFFGHLWGYIWIRGFLVTKLQGYTEDIIN
jgi:hypothetical protein